MRRHVKFSSVDFQKSLAYICYFILWSPCLVNIEMSTDSEKIDFLQSIFLCSVFWILLLAVLGRLWIALTISLPAAFLLPLEMWMRIYQGHPIDAHIFSVLMETNGREINDFISAYGWPIIITTSLCMVTYLLAINSSFRLNISWNHISRKWIAIIILPILSIYLIYEIVEKKAPSQDEFLLDGRDYSGVGIEWSEVYPINVVMAVEQFHKQQQSLNKIQAIISQRELKVQHDSQGSPDLAILVIGESATVTHWPIYGYDRNTTPRMNARENKVVFTNVIALSTATRTAIPGVLSPRPLLKANGDVDMGAAPSLVRVFREAGYRTHWISNQAPFGKHDTAVSVYAREAEDIRFLNVDNYSRESSYDSVLLRSIEGILDDPGKHLIVVHLLGSHFDYAFRYPLAFDHFIPSSRNQLSPTPKQINNSYDNSIRYTDYILDQIIEAVEGSGKSAFVSYFSDHGVDPSIGRCATQSGVRRSEAAYRVPALIWLSREYIAIHPNSLDRLNMNISKPYMTRAMYSTMLDLSGINVGDGLPEENFFIPPKAEAVREVPTTSGVFVNFDEAMRINSCNINFALSIAN